MELIGFIRKISHYFKSEVIWWDNLRPLKFENTLILIFSGFSLNKNLKKNVFCAHYLLRITCINMGKYVPLMSIFEKKMPCLGGKRDLHFFLFLLLSKCIYQAVDLSKNVHNVLSVIFLLKNMCSPYTLLYLIWKFYFFNGFLFGIFRQSLDPGFVKSNLINFTSPSRTQKW